MNLLERKTRLLLDHVEALRQAVRNAKEKQSFHIDAWVVLPDHTHAIWTLPPADMPLVSAIKT